MRLCFVRVLLASAVAACASSAGSPDAGPPVDAIPQVDSDGDSIGDDDEGRAAAVDSDGDTTPDYLDADSDGDGLTDALEAGDAEVGSAPLDSDRDGSPDFRDTDSDGNGRPDAVDGSGDLDGDGRGDFADLDDDGDGIDDVIELGADAASPVDGDGDGTPDFHDLESDGDGVADQIETGDDFDEDGTRNFRDLDSDGDCRPDAIEAGTPVVDSDGDRRPDFLDRDSDGDGVADQAEDADCDGVLDPDETSATSGDTDGDGAPDIVETEAGTGGNDASDNPQARGDFVFIEPYQEPQSPVSDVLDFSTRLRQVDLYLMLDRSSSMQDEISHVKAHLTQVVSRLMCADDSDVGCVEDLWVGAGTIGYQFDQPFAHYADVQPSLSIAAMNTAPPSQAYNSREATAFALWSAITGLGTAAAAGCDFARADVTPTPSRATCAGSPAGALGPATGYPCFRDGSLPVVLLATDEPPLATGQYTVQCPAWATVVRAAIEAVGGKVVGVYGSRENDDDEPVQTATRLDLETIARDTGAVTAGSNTPLVFPGAAQGAAAAIEEGVRTLFNQLPLDLSARAIDDPSDGVDAVAAFVSHLETLQSGVGRCTAGLMHRDGPDADATPDEFVAVRTGTPVCWTLVTRPNTTVPPGDEPQLLKATIEVEGDGVTALDTRDVYFLVPPRPIDGPVD
jgi:hypothetical protein